MENQLLKFGKCIIDSETKFMGADVYLITSIKGETDGYQFYAPDEKTLLARFGWETAEREEAKKGGFRGFVKKAAEAAKAAFKGQACAAAPLGAVTAAAGIIICCTVNGDRKGR